MINKRLHTTVELWKEDVRKQFPQLEPCEIGEYVGVNLALKGVVYPLLLILTAVRAVQLFVASAVRAEQLPDPLCQSAREFAVTIVGWSLF